MTVFPCTRTIYFETGLSSLAVEVTLDLEPADILEKLALSPIPSGVIPISGGADDYPDEVLPQTRLIISTVLRLAFDKNILIVDGGTKTGVMREIGLCFAQAKRVRQTKNPPPLIGFVPEFMVTYPGAPSEPRCSEPEQLDPNHPYFVLLHGVKEWGGEVDCMFTFVEFLAKGIPSVAIIANGGPTTLRETVYSIRQGREIVVLEGSKRAAEAIAAVVSGEPQTEFKRILYNTEIIRQEDSEEKLRQALECLEEIAHYDKITCFDIHESPDVLNNLILSKLGMI
jgi:hypothetical protein